MYKEIQQVLKHSRLFMGLRPDLIDEIASSATLRTLGTGQVLFQKGDPADALWGVLSGNVVFETRTDDGKELVLDSFGKGDVFGEVGVLDFGPRREEARATETSKLFRLERKYFLQYLHASTELSFRMFSLLCSHLRETTENFEDSALYKVPERLAKKLSMLVAESEGSNDTVVHILQSDLARMLGVHRETVNRALREFEKDGLIRLKRQQIEILDQQALSDLASPAQNVDHDIWGPDDQAITFAQPHNHNSTHPAKRSVGLLAVDAAEYSSALMTDAAGTLERIEVGLEAVDRAIEQCQGRIVWHTGDRVLAEFPDAMLAMQAALDIQGQTSPSSRKGLDQSLFHIGVHHGEVVADNNHFTGQAVTTVIQLTRLSSAGGIAISGNVRNALENRERLTMLFLGDHELKNVSGTVSVYSAHTVPLLKKLELRAEALVPRRSRPAVAAVSTIIILAGFWFGGDWIGRHSVPVSVAPLSIAVLPFSTGGDEELDYLAEGIPQELRKSLSMIPGMRVIGQESSDYYKSRTASTQEIGQTLEVAWLLRGNFESAENEIHVTAQLLNTANSEVIWEGQFGAIQENLAGFGTGIFNEIAMALGFEDDEGAVQPRSVPLTTNSEAYALYLKAHNGMLKGRQEHWIEAYYLYKEATELDPSFAEAHAKLAMMLYSTVLDQEEGLTPAVRQELSKQALNKAILLKPDSSLVLAVASRARQLSGDFEGALALAQKAVKLDPNNTESLGTQRWVMAKQGNLPAVFRIAQKQLELEPLSLMAMYGVQQQLMLRGRYEDVIAIADRALALYPENEVLIAHTWIAEAKLKLGDRVGAVVSYRKGLPATDPIDLWTGLDYDQQALDEYQTWWSFGAPIYIEEYNQVREMLMHRHNDAESNSKWLDSVQYLISRAELEALVGDFGASIQLFERAEALSANREDGLFSRGITSIADGTRQSYFPLAWLFAYRKTGQHEKADDIALRIEARVASTRGRYSEIPEASKQNEYNGLYPHAQYYAIEGRTAEALETLRTWVEHGTIFTYVSWDPYLENLRGNPEFEIIVAEVEAELAEVRAQYHAR